MIFAENILLEYEHDTLFKQFTEQSFMLEADNNDKRKLQEYFEKVNIEYLEFKKNKDQATPGKLSLITAAAFGCLSLALKFTGVGSIVQIISSLISIIASLISMSKSIKAEKENINEFKAKYDKKNLGRVNALIKKTEDERVLKQLNQIKANLQGTIKERS